MERAIRGLLLLLALAGAGCAADYAERYRLAHPGWTPAPPAAGDSLDETLASLQTAPGGPFEVSVRELRVLRVDAEPWEELSLDDALAESEARSIAVIAHRRCRGRQGIRFFGSERTSWYVFVGGELVAYDHFELGEACEPANHYLPSQEEHLATEQALIRYAALRHPESTPTALEMLGKGLALLSAGRLADAERMLRSADREIDRMEDQHESEPEEEREAFETKEEELRSMRARLSRAIADARRQEVEPSPQGSGR